MKHAFFISLGRQSSSATCPVEGGRCFAFPNCEPHVFSATRSWEMKSISDSSFLWVPILHLALYFCATFCAPIPMCSVLFTLFSLLFISLQCSSEGISVTNMAAGSSPCKMLLKRCLELLDFKVHTLPSALLKGMFKIDQGRKIFLYPCE